MSKLNLDKAYSLYELRHMPENISKKKKIKVYDEKEEGDQTMVSSSRRESRLDRIEKLLIDNQNQIRVMQQQIIEMQRQIIDTQKEMREGFENVNKRIDRLEDRLDYIVKANKLKDKK